ncbi:hypothetical protein [Allokutzneria albata]|uniref:Uncharacterized protein n=1 Tax=Allokutzneria albata TaxID=211114 RepID=A0A1H0DMN1_ALLAB|nr:hypothetical protein [Allokutzneria albata]SDN71328.1 hypothetical protein SAMN04489726_7890 [Allokutzneria albata]
MSDFDLPPKRALPFEVRMSMRAKLDEGMSAPRRSRMSFGALFATATLLAGTAVGAPLLFGAADEGPMPGGDPNYTPKGHERAVASLVKDKDVDLERCWQAARTSGRTELPADLSRWRAVFRQSTTVGDVTAIRAGDSPLFCHTTKTQVHLLHSDTSGKDSDHAVTLHAVSRFGFLGGSTSRDTVTVHATAEEYVVHNGVPKTSYYREGTTAVDGLFVLPTISKPGALSLTSNGINRRRVTKLGHRRPAPTPVVTVTDRPLVASRDSALGQELSACIASAASTTRPAPDPDSWEPALALDLGKHGRMLVARSGDVIGLCQAAGEVPGFWAMPQRDAAVRPPAPSAERPVVMGALRTPELEVSMLTGRARPEVTSVTLVDEIAGERLPTELSNGIFVALPVTAEPRSSAGSGAGSYTGSWQAEITERTPTGGRTTRTVSLSYL